jgi:predicted dehydrogenase
MSSSHTAGGAGRPTVRLMTLEPGHFHAALVQKEMYPQVDPRVNVYGPLGPDLIAHLARIASFNTRPERPTEWEAEVHAAPDFLEVMERERPGNVVVLAGRNRRKIEYIVRAVERGFNVLADKPWIVRSADLPSLARALEEAEAARLVAYDIMTERYEITNMLQRELVRDPEILGEVLPGSPSEPAVYMRSVHHILKTVAGTPLKRPAWFFDPEEQGEPLADVGTHLVDLAIWTLFPDTPPDVDADVRLLSARGWATPLNRDQFRQVTGEHEFPPFLAPWVEGNSLLCPFNQQMVFSLGGTHVELDVLWDVESPHGDTHDAFYRGSRASVEVRQGEKEAWIPEVYVTPKRPADRPLVASRVRERVERLSERWPGIEVHEEEDRIRIGIPERYRVGHEHHFAEVTERFLEYLADPAAMPEWEKRVMLVKYAITTQGTDLARQRSRVSP